MMKLRLLLSTILLWLIPSVVGWAQTFDTMVSTMTQQSLPLVNLEFDTTMLNFQSFITGKITIAEHDSDSTIMSQYDCLVRMRGKTALFLPKKSFAVKLVDEYGEKLDANLLGLREENSWILDAMGIDRLRMRNRVCFDIWEEYSHTMWDTSFGNRNGTVGTMVEVFVNGDYNGIYHLSDKINRQLLNLRKAKVNSDGTVTIKGVLYKGKNGLITNTLMEYEQASVDTTMWNSFELQYPEDYPCQDAWQPLMDIIDFNGTTTDQYFAEHYNEWYYTSNLVDYWCLLVAFNIMDMPYKNTFLSTPDINFGHQYMLSPWDLDASLGRDYNGKVANYPAEFGRLNFYAPFNRLIAGNIDNFKGKIASRWAELTQTALSPANLESHINAIAQRFVESGAWQREYERWQGTRVAINANINSEINYVKGWYGRNYNYISTGMAFWREDINAHTVTLMYNYLLGDDGTFYDFLDLNRDGAITATDITIAYNIMLNQ